VIFWLRRERGPVAGPDLDGGDQAGRAGAGGAVPNEAGLCSRVGGITAAGW